MLQNIWRNAHFWLAAVSVLFILMASISGAILAFEPIYIQSDESVNNKVNELSLAQLLPKLKQQYEEILSLQVDAHQRVTLSTFEGDFYINPETGKQVGDLYQQPELFEWTTKFHRSLFLKTPGRIFVAIVSALLLLITLTGLALLVKRLGWKKFVFPFAKTDKESYYHSYLGRINLIPLLLVTLTGILLAFEQLEWLDTNLSQQETLNESTSELVKPLDELPIFQNTLLADVKSLEFPFSDDPEEYYILLAANGEYHIHQLNGDIVKFKSYPIAHALAQLSFKLHTGAGYFLWPLVLFGAMMSVFYFTYSGAIMSYKRLSAKQKNSYTAQEAEYVILVGSENGRTQQFAKQFYQALIQQKLSAFITDLNKLEAFPKMKQLFVMTSTYGAGEAPSNATQFLEKLPQFLPQQQVKFSVLGFGSTLYLQFCQFAKDVNTALEQHACFEPITNPVFVDGGNQEQIAQWLQQWQDANQLKLSINLNENKGASESKHQLKVLRNWEAHDGVATTFCLELGRDNLAQFTPGDLLAIVPEAGAQPREYSLGKSKNGNLFLSIKQHEKGLCSNYLYNLKPGDELEVTLIPNPNFHLKADNLKTVLIANGTGVAPFVGMLHQTKNTDNVTLLWGVRKKSVFNLLNEEFPVLEKEASKIEVAFSREEEGEQYVQNIIENNPEKYAQLLEQGTVFMLCGSLKMRDGVLGTLEKACEKYLSNTLQFYQENGQILTDCY